MSIRTPAATYLRRPITPLGRIFIRTDMIATIIMVTRVLFTITGTGRSASDCARLHRLGVMTMTRCMSLVERRYPPFVRQVFA